MFNIKSLARMAICTALIVVCSWLTVPFTVPFTMQTFAVFLAVGVLGGKRGTLAVLVYILLGCVGIPVFSGFSGGVGILMGSTGGYIVGFLVAAALMWVMEKVPGNRTAVLVGSMVLGLIACYAFGTAWFVTVYAKTTGPVGVWTALGWCVFPYIVPDLVKIALALVLCKRLKKAIRL